MKKSIRRNTVYLALLVSLCFAVAANADSRLLYQNNGSTSVFPDNPPPVTLDTNGAPYVFYTLNANGQLTENYYDADGRLRYALGIADELYSETAWYSLTHPFPKPNESSLTLQQFDDFGRVRSIQLLDDERDIDVSYGKHGSKVISLSETPPVNAGDAVVSSPAVTINVYYEENEKIGTCDIQSDLGSVMEYLFYYDDLAPDHLVSVSQFIMPDFSSKPTHSNVYAFTYVDDRVKEIMHTESGGREQVQYLTFYYSGDKRERVTLSGTNDDGSTGVIEEYVYIYGEDGTLWSLQKTKDGETVEDYQMYYDEYGRIVEFMYTDYSEADSRRSMTSFYAYDENGFLSEQTDIRPSADEESAETVIRQYERDAEGRVTGILTIDDLSGGLLNSLAIEYGEKAGEAADSSGADNYVEYSEETSENDDPAASDEQYGELGSQTEVPYGRLKLEVEEQVNLRYRNCLSYSFEAYHEPDVESHTDRVRISTTVNYHYGGYVSDQTIVFEYNRASDLWSVFSNPEWPKWTAFWYPEKFIGTWYGTYMCDNRECYYNLVIDDIDFDRMVVTGGYSVESWSWDWNDKLEKYDYERPIIEDGELPIVRKSGNFTIGVHEFNDVYTTHDFIISPEHGVQFRDYYHGGKITDALRIQVVE